MPKLSVGQAGAALKAAGWPNSRIPIMIAIGMGESELDTDATGPVGELGWLMIHPPSHPELDARNQNWRDPVVNARMALHVFNKQGYSAWTIFNNKTYTKFLDAARAWTSGVISPLPGAGIIGAAGELASDGAGGIGEQIFQFNEILVAAGEWITSRHNWLRIAYVTSGVALVIVTVAVISAPTVERTARRAKKVLPV